MTGGDMQAAETSLFKLVLKCVQDFSGKADRLAQVGVRHPTWRGPGSQGHSVNIC